MLWQIDSQLVPAPRQRLISPLPWTTFGQTLELVPASNGDQSVVPWLTTLDNPVPPRGSHRTSHFLPRWLHQQCGNHCRLTKPAVHLPDYWVGGPSERHWPIFLDLRLGCLQSSVLPCQQWWYRKYRLLVQRQPSHWLDGLQSCLLSHYPQHFGGQTDKAPLPLPLQWQPQSCLLVRGRLGDKHGHSPRPTDALQQGRS